MRDEDTLIDDDEDSPAPVYGWGARDVARLDELADMGMALCRSLTRQTLAREEAVEAGAAEPLTPAEASRISLDFARFARQVRLSLALKAHACGAEGRGAPSRTDPADPDAPVVGPDGHVFYPDQIGVMHPLDEPGYPSSDDPEAMAAFHTAEVRAALTHALTDPARSEAENEAMRERAERYLEREYERDGERYWNQRSPRYHIEAICKDLGLDHRGIHPGALGEDGDMIAWCVPRRHEPDPCAPLILPGDATLRPFHVRWNTGATPLSRPREGAGGEAGAAAEPSRPP